MISLFLQVLTGVIASGVFALCFDHLRRTHPAINNPIHWVLALCFCIASVWVVFSAIQRMATLGDLSAVVGAVVWLVDTWEARHVAVSRPIFYPIPRELQPIELNPGRRHESLS